MIILVKPIYLFLTFYPIFLESIFFKYKILDKASACLLINIFLNKVYDKFIIYILYYEFIIFYSK